MHVVLSAQCLMNDIIGVPRNASTSTGKTPTSNAMSPGANLVQFPKRATRFPYCPALPALPTLHLFPLLFISTALSAARASASASPHALTPSRPHAPLARSFHVRPAIGAPTATASPHACVHTARGVLHGLHPAQAPPHPRARHPSLSLAQALPRHARPLHAAPMRQPLSHGAAALSRR